MKTETTIKSSGFGIGLQGKYRLQVVDAASQEIVADHGWNKNLILNVGMDAIASTYLASLNYAGTIGTGSRPNYLTASTSFITQSGNYISLLTYGDWTSFTQSVYTGSSATACYTSSINKGDIIVDENFSQSMVVSIENGSMVYVNTSQSYSTPLSFSVWKTQQSLMQGESKRSNTYYVSDVGWNNGTYYTASMPGVFTHRRTYDFTPETQTMSYTEVGVSWTNTSKASIFSRAVLPNSVSVSPGQLIRMTHDLMVAYTPTGSVYRTASISGWGDVLCTESVQNWCYSGVNTSGGTVTLASFYVCLDPIYGSGYCGSNGFQCFLSADSRSLDNYGTASDRGYFVTRANGSADTYVNGTFTRTRSVTFPITAYSSSVNFIRTIGFGTFWWNCPYGGTVYPEQAGQQAYLMRLEESQSKLNTETLTLTWRWRWGRILQ